MEKTAKIMEERKISHEDQGAVLIDFTTLVPGKEGKRLGKTVLRYASQAFNFINANLAIYFAGSPDSCSCTNPPCTERRMVLLFT